MISKFSVKKPLTVIMALLMVIVLGYVSFTSMKTDLLPNMDLPYVAIITTYVGASPEKVEVSLTKPLEQVLATTNGVEDITSVSAENYSAVILEFSRKTNLDTAIIEMSSNAAQVVNALGDSVGTPIYMKINPDLLPVVIASVDIEGADRYEVAKTVEEDILPQLERVDGVASVSAIGLIENTMKITINQDKIDVLNERVLEAVDEKLLETEKELDDAQKKLDEGKQTLEDTKAEQNKTLAEATVTLQSGITQVTVIKTVVDAVTTTFDKVDGLFADANDLLKEAKNNTDEWTDYRPQILTLLEKIKTNLTSASAAIDSITTFIDSDSELLGGIYDRLMTTQSKIDKWLDRCEKIDALTQKSITPSEAIKQLRLLVNDLRKEVSGIYDKLADTANQLESQDELLKEQQMTLEEGKLVYSNEIAAAEAKLTNAQEKLDEGITAFEEAKKAAYEKAGLDDAITIDTISALISAENFSMPVGSISENNIAYSVKIGDLFADDKELIDWEMFNITAGDIGVITIEDIADIEYIDNSDSMYAKVNGNNGIILTLDKQSTYSTTDVAHGVQDKIKELEGMYQGLSITSLSDQGDYIDLVINSVIEALITGGILAILILLVFLKDIKPTFIIAISIPVSLLFAIVLMYFSGISINIISLSGLALGVGMLVDNSIVVVENIYRLKMLGMPIKEASIEGAKQVGGAIIASTLTTISVFIPILFTEGITRQIFADMGLTIAFSLVASLLVALTVVPSLGSIMLGRSEPKKSVLFSGIKNGYARLLEGALNKKAVVFTLVLLLLFVSIFGVTQMGTEFIPESDTKQMSLSIELPVGNTKDDAIAMSETVIERLLQIEDVDTIAAMQTGSGSMSMLSMGGGNDRTVSMYILLKDDRAITSKEAGDLIEKTLADLECTVDVATANMSMSMLTGEGVEVVVKGSDLDSLQESAKAIGAMLEGIEGTYDIVTGTEDAKQEIRIVVDKNAAMENGYTVAQVYMKVAEAIKTEATATTIEVGDEEYSVVISENSENLVTTETLKNLELEVADTGMGEDADDEPKVVRLCDIAEIRFADTPKSISHDNQMRTMSVTASVDSAHNIGKVSAELETKLKKYDFQGDCTYELAGENEYIVSALQDLGYMLLIAIAFIYMIMVAQFQSLKSPFIVMFTIPLAFTGGLLLLWILGFNLSVVAMLGFLVLSGVVVNNGIVFVDYANQLVEGGMEVRKALLETGRDRIRPIIMTAITTILGLTTIAFAIGDGTDMVQPMGIVVIGGLLYATVLTLFVIPSLYEVFNKKKATKPIGTDDGQLEESDTIDYYDAVDVVNADDAADMRDSKKKKGKNDNKGKAQNRKAKSNTYTNTQTH